MVGRMSRRERSNEDVVKGVEWMIRAAGRRVADGDPEDLDLLTNLHNVVEAAVAEAVEGQRETGFSWGDIARGLKVTRQSAHERFGRRRVA